jgi:hypothetical protein
VNAKDAPTKRERERAAELREQELTATAAGISVTANTAPQAVTAKAATAKACCAGHAGGQDHSAECATQPPVADAPAPSAAGFARGDDAQGWPTHPNILDDESTDDEGDDLHNKVTHHILYNYTYIYTLYVHISCTLSFASR